jgi:hypothetical protein
MSNSIINLKLTPDDTLWDIVTQHLSGLIFIVGCGLIVWACGGFDDWLPKKNQALRGHVSGFTRELR